MARLNIFYRLVRFLHQPKAQTPPPGGHRHEYVIIVPNGRKFAVTASYDDAATLASYVAIAAERSVILLDRNEEKALQTFDKEGRLC